MSPSAGGVVLRPRLRPTPGSPSLVVPLQALAHLLEWDRCSETTSGYGTVGAVPFRFKRSGVSQGSSPRRPMARRAGAGPSSCLKGRSSVVSCCACRRTCWVLPRVRCASGRRTFPLPRSRPWIASAPPRRGVLRHFSPAVWPESSFSRSPAASWPSPAASGLPQSPSVVVLMIYPKVRRHQDCRTGSGPGPVCSGAGGGDTGAGVCSGSGSAGAGGGPVVSIRSAMRSASSAEPRSWAMASAFSARNRSSSASRSSSRMRSCAWVSAPGSWVVPAS